MTKTFKLFLTIIMGLALTFISCFERNDMYDFAKNGVKVIYAINVSSDKVYIATDDSYYKEYTVTTSYGSTGKGCYPLNGKIIGVEDDAGIIYFHSYDRSSWSYPFHNLGGTPTAMFLMDNKIYYSYGDYIYYFTGDSYQTLQTMITPATFISMTQYNGEIYLFTGSSIFKYDNDDTANDTISGTITPGTTFKFFAIVDGIVYVGYDTKFNYNKLGANSPFTTASPANIQSYAVYNSSAVFAAGYSTQIDIMKLEEGSFNTIKHITVSSAPTVVIEALSETKLVIGIAGSTSHDGLYILDTETGKMKTLTTDPIGAINIFDH